MEDTIEAIEKELRTALSEKAEYERRESAARRDVTTATNRVNDLRRKLLSKLGDLAKLPGANGTDLVRRERGVTEYDH